MHQTTYEYRDTTDFDAHDAPSATGADMSTEATSESAIELTTEAGMTLHLLSAQVSPETTSMNPQPIDIVELYTEHRSHLLRFVQRYVGNHEDAEDVVQNTFIEAVKCAHRFSGLSKPSTWLFGIALNLARNQVRRNIADRYDSVDDTFMEQIVDKHADPAKLFELRQIAEKIDGLLSELPPRIRTTFEAVLDGDATYEEAAEQLQIPIGTVRSRVSRVRAAVRQEYGNGRN